MLPVLCTSIDAQEDIREHFQVDDLQDCQACKEVAENIRKKSDELTRRPWNVVRAQTAGGGMRSLPTYFLGGARV
jgi:hypothetical protein